jgi:hypothetical protein
MRLYNKPRRPQVVKVRVSWSLINRSILVSLIKEFWSQRD